MSSDEFPSAEIAEYLRRLQQDYSAAHALNPTAVEKAKMERELLSTQVRSIFDTLSPFFPAEARYEVHVADDVDVALTDRISGIQVIVVSRHYIAFLRNLIEMLASGLKFNSDGAPIVRFGMTKDEKELYGKNLGEFLELGVPLTFPTTHSAELGPDILVAATEFIIAHEITHAIEAHDHNLDPTLTGFQDYCRLRGREYQCDRKSLGLLLLRRKRQSIPELAFAGGVAALLGVSWLEQFTPGFVPGGESQLHHPGSDSRVLRLYLEEPLYWRAAELKGLPRDISGAFLRRAFLFMGALEQEPNLIATPLNHLVNRCIVDGQPNHDLFATLMGELFARGRVRRVAQSLGGLWGSAESMVAEEETSNSSPTELFASPAVELFEGLHSRLTYEGVSAVANDMAEARLHRMETRDL